VAANRCRPSGKRRTHPFLAVLFAALAMSGVRAESPAPHWSIADAKALLVYIAGIEAEGLIPADYAPQALRRAIEAGGGTGLDVVADASFAALVEDLRDGRTPVDDRGAWYVDDEDIVRDPTDAVMARALRSHDIAGTLGALDPTSPDYAVLKAALAATPVGDVRRRALIRVNMDRWRWFPRDFGEEYLVVNVPEFRLRHVKARAIIRNYRVIVGKPGDTATPLLAEKATAVIFNPVWTVPQPIVESEGLGARLLANPNAARARGYVVSRNANGSLAVIQQPGPANMLGKVKIDVPNAYGIYLHDTPSQDLFAREVPALSHGCVRVKGALELAGDLVLTHAGTTSREVAAMVSSGKMQQVALARPIAVYTTYFTMTETPDGRLGSLLDIYGWDASVLASFTRPRVSRAEVETP